MVEVGTGHHLPLEVPKPRIESMTIPAPDHKRYFIEKLGLSERLMER